jgi:short-subunit dehydrogenase
MANKRQKGRLANPIDTGQRPQEGGSDAPDTMPPMTAEMDLDGRHVLITGGSRGLGLAMAHEFAGAGASLTLVARGRDALEKAAADVGGRALVADMADSADVDGLVQRSSDLAGAPVDVLVLNAGIDANGPFSEVSARDLRQLWLVNVVAPAELMRQARPLMAAHGGGRVVVISSLSAQVAMPGLAAYSATKAALSQFVMGVRGELRRDGINTTLVEIGQAITDMYAELRDYQPAAAAFDRANRLGLLRDLKPENVARAVVAGVRRGKQTVVLPKRARFQSAMAHTPQVVADRVLRLR